MHAAAVRVVSLRLLANDKVADLGHVFDCEADAFAAEAAVFDAAVGHVVDSP